MAVSNEKKIELLEQLMLMDVWNDFLLPEYKEASEILVFQLKSCKDQNESFKLIGQLIGLDAIINLPHLLQILKAQAEQQKQDAPPEPPSAEKA